MAFGGSFNQASASSQSQSTGSTFVDPSQQPFLDFLRNTGVGLFGQQQQGLQGLFGTSQDLFGQGQQLIQGAQQNPFLQGLQQQAGGNPELVAAQTQQLGTDIGQFFQQQILPGISRQATGVGQLGGGRQGVAQGLAAQGAGQAFQRGAVGFQQADAQRSLQAGLGGGQLALGGAQTGLEGLSGLQGLLESPFGTQMQSLMALLASIGGPTVLSEQQATSQSESSSFGVSAGGI